MKRFFKTDAGDCGFRPGVVYLEFEDEWPTRQVEIYGDRWLSSLDEYHDELGPGLCDQPLSVLELTAKNEIGDAEFESIWQEALRRREEQKHLLD